MHKYSPTTNSAKDTVPPWTSCGVCPVGELQGLAVECFPPKECGSRWRCQTGYRPHMLPMKLVLSNEIGANKAQKNPANIMYTRNL